VKGTGLTGGQAWIGEQDINARIGIFTGEQGNDVKDVDAALFGDPNADKEADKPGSVADAAKENRENADKLHERPDPSKYGAFG
jgi:hypothetical protein